MIATSTKNIYQTKFLWRNTTLNMTFKKLYLCANTMSHFSAEDFFLSRLSSESLELLIDFLAYLERKSWSKKQKLVNIQLPQTQTLGILCPWP